MKAHLLTSDFPLVDGQTQTADCGAEVERAKILFLWDDMEVGSTAPISTVAICNKCVIGLLSKREVRPRYIYGISTRPTEQ